MNDLSTAFLLWLADFYLLTTILLISVLIVLFWIKQPVQKLALIRATLVGLCLLAVLCAIPNWSIVHLAIGDADSKPVSEIISEPSVMPVVSPAQFEPSLIQPEMTVVPNSMPKPIDWQAIEAPPIAPAEIKANQAVMPWAIIGATLFVAGSCLTMLWILLGSWRIAKLCRQSAPAAGHVRQLLVSLIDASTLLPRLLVNRRLPTAVAFGLRQPTILLPRSLTDRGDPGQLRSVLAHEWAHLDNGDLKLLAAVRLLMVLLWAQPFYWVLRVRLRLEQETLADAAAAELTSCHDYAQQLVGWARSVPAGSHQRFASAIGIWEGPSQLRRRIAILLDDKLTILKTCSRRWRMMVATVCVATVASLSLFTLAAPGISNAKTNGTNEMGELSEAIPDHVVRVIESHNIPFMTEERLTEIRAEFATLVTTHQRNDLSDERKQAILAAIENHGSDHLRLGSFQSTQLRSLNQAYLKLPDRLLTLQWKIWNAISQPPLSSELQQRLNDQRRWMTDYVDGLPPYHTFTNVAALAELTSRFNDPLCSTLDRPMTDAQFADFQTRLQKYPRDKALNNVVTHLVQKSLYAQYNNFHEFDLPFEDELCGYGAGQVVHLNFVSKRRHRGDTQALRDIDNSHSVVDAITGHSVSSPKLVQGSRQFQNWLDENGKGDFALDAKGLAECNLFAVRDAKLVTLDAENWFEADSVSDDSLRTLLNERGEDSVSLKPLFEAIGARSGMFLMHHSTVYIGVLTKEGRLAVVHVEDCNGVEIKFRVRPRALSIGQSLSEHIGAESKAKEDRTLWGKKNVDGLQAKLRRAPQPNDHRFAYGDTLLYEFIVRNTTDEPVELEWISNGWNPTIHDDNVDLVGMIFINGLMHSGKATIAAHETRSIQSIQYVVRPADYSAEDLDQQLRIAPGKYRATASLAGVTTGAVEIEIAEQASAEKGSDDVHPDNPLRLDDETLIKLFRSGAVLLNVALNCESFYHDRKRLPKDVPDFATRYQEQGRAGIGNDPFAPGQKLRFVLDEERPRVVQVWSVGPDGKWDGGRQIDSTRQPLDGDLGVEIKVGNTDWHWLADKGMSRYLEGKRLAHYLASKGPKLPNPELKEDGLKWGPVVDGLQLAVELNPKKDSYQLGQPIDVRFHVRNAVNYVIQVGLAIPLRQDMSQRSVFIYDAEGKRVEGRNRWMSGTVSTKQTTLRPGETAMYQSSDLAFIAPGEKLDPRTQVGCSVEANPGEYRVEFKQHFPIGYGSDPHEWQGVLKTEPVTIRIDNPLQQSDGSDRGEMGDSSTESSPSNKTLQEAWHKKKPLVFGPVCELKVILDKKGQPVFLDLQFDGGVSPSGDVDIADDEALKVWAKPQKLPLEFRLAGKGFELRAHDTQVGIWARFPADEQTIVSRPDAIDDDGRLKIDESRFDETAAHALMQSFYDRAGAGTRFDVDNEQSQLEAREQNRNQRYPIDDKMLPAIIEFWDSHGQLGLLHIMSYDPQKRYLKMRWKTVQVVEED